MIEENVSWEIFMVFTAEQCDQGNVNPTWRFMTNHGSGFWGSLSGLEQPQQNYKALCF